MSKIYYVICAAVQGDEVCRLGFIFIPTAERLILNKLKREKHTSEFPKQDKDTFMNFQP